MGTRLASSFRPTLLSFASVLVAATTVAADELADVLGLVPDDAVAWAVIPNLSRTNADLSDLIDRADRPELAVAGRPVDVLVSQLGVAAGFDERGSLAIWSPTIDDLLVGAGVAAVPVESAARFLEANLAPEPAGGEGAYRRPDGTLLFARVLDDHVLLAPRRDLLDGWEAGSGVDRLGTPFGAEPLDDMRRMDVLLRITGDAVDAAQDAADRDVVGFEPPGGAEAITPEMMELADDLRQAVGGAEDIVVGLDADALALGIRGWTRYASGSVAAIAASGARPGSSPLASLPAGPYYLALGIDFKALGGAFAFRELQRLLGDRLGLDDRTAELADVVDGVAFSVRPSKLGIAMGGVLNDAGVVITTRDPKRVATAVGEAVASLDGVDGAVERSATFERGVEQRNGRIADQITVKTEIADADRREPGSRVGDASIVLTATNLTFGPRGWLGLGRDTESGYVVTFSRRPDVLDRFTNPDGLDGDPVITAMSGWMPAAPGMQAFVDVGRIARLARQVATLVPGGEQIVPDLDLEMPPIGFGLSLSPSANESAVLEWGAVVPSEVIGITVGLAISDLLGAPEGAGP
ncbi:MAG: hypothetical protein VX012_02815 [Planctomycetota bacterium]|nr:hypothetical protein [Planctomycetota bacterium]